jgi:hypothetical protein
VTRPRETYRRAHAPRPRGAAHCPASRSTPSGAVRRPAIAHPPSRRDTATGPIRWGKAPIPSVGATQAAGSGAWISYAQGWFSPGREPAQEGLNPAARKADGRGSDLPPPACPDGRLGGSPLDATPNPPPP